jgi:glutaminyl-peptide cyclotransferase
MLLGASRPQPAAPPEEYSYRIVKVFPHDRSAFTEGLEYHDGFLYESTGLTGHSTLRRVELETGKVVQEIALASRYFGEGITVLNQRIIQLTWQTQIGFIYNQTMFTEQAEFRYPGEGWALTNDGKHIYMSDGTPQIRCWDPATLAETRRITVHDGTGPVTWANELEYVGGRIYANVWQSDRVAIISPVDGRVVGWMDLAGLLTSEEREQTDVLNGIAYDAARNRLFVTGKLWPKLFQIEMVPKVVSGHPIRGD